MSNSGEIVTVANPWIICRSKTHAGRIYYFNTGTGEAVWNLSLSEIENAKKRTRMLESDSNFKVDNCPEPMHSPTDNSNTVCSKKLITTQRVTPSKVYNKQIINNQFAKPPFPFTAQLSHYGPINPAQFSVQINPPINQGVWNFTPPPIFTTSEVVSPVVRQSMNNYDYVTVTNTSVPLSCRFKSQGQSESTDTLHPNRTGPNLNAESSCHGTRSFNYKSNRNMDLRLLLSTKKKNASNIDISTSNFNDATSILQRDDDEDISLLKDDFKTVLVDSNPLKKLLRIEDEFEVWYIVADSNVFLNNINFINIVLDSDSQCRLMVPQIVMDQIQSAVNTRLRTRAHRAAYFISQKIDANIAVIDKGNVNEICDYKDKIINNCMQLTDQGYHVILITDDIELHNVESTVNFPMFTVRELKNILNNIIPTPCTVDKGNINKCMSTENRNIKITISNTNLNPEGDIEKTGCSPKISLNTKLLNDNVTENKADLLVDSFVQTDVVNKKTDDIGIQAELDKLPQNDENNSNNNMKICPISTGVPLQRSFSYDNHIQLDNRIRKNYNKWHRRKTKSNLSINSKSSTVSETDSYINKDNIHGYDQPGSNLSCQVSPESLHNPTLDNIFEDSSDSCSVKRCSFVKNVVVDETSTSESSNIGSVEASKEYVNNRRTEITTVETNNIENVMFEVTSNAMAECLRTKCDEWISRFVQVMEEAMSQILQQDPPFILDTMLPPWTIYEAAECVRRKFHYDHDTVDAATKLLNVLFEIGGLRGKVKIDLSPHKYMELYSFGVYLIDALQGLLNSSEDLQTAAESLSKLLSDIQDSHLNSSIQDSFNDVPSESFVNMEILDDTCIENIEASKGNEDKMDGLDKNFDQNMQPVRKIQRKVIESLTSSPGKYNLRSQRKNTIQEKEKTSDNVTFIRNIDLKSSFFTNLDLRKKSYEEKTSIAEIGKSNNGNIERQDDKDVEDNAKSKDTEAIETQQENTNEPKVIRNFTTCPEFEKKLKFQLAEEETYDSWTSKRDDNENDVGPYYDEMAEQYYGSDNSNNYENNDMFDKDLYYNSFENNGIDIDEQDGSPIPKSNIKFKQVFEKIEHNIKQAFESVYEFCQQSHSKLSLEGNNLDKINIQQSAVKMQLYVNKLCDSLNSIVARGDSLCKILELFSIEEFQNIVVEDGDLEGYRNFVIKCAEKGNILKDSVELIIEAAK